MHSASQLADWQCLLIYVAYRFVNVTVCVLLSYFVSSVIMSKRSIIWTIFVNDTEAANAETAQCKLCMNKIKHSGGTKNLWQHLERHHKTEHKQLMEKERDASNANVSCTAGQCLRICILHFFIFQKT